MIIAGVIVADGSSSVGIKPRTLRLKPQCPGRLRHLVPKLEDLPGGYLHPSVFTLMNLFQIKQLTQLTWIDATNVEAERWKVGTFRITFIICGLHLRKPGRSPQHCWQFSVQVVPAPLTPVAALRENGNCFNLIIHFLFGCVFIQSKMWCLMQRFLPKISPACAHSLPVIKIGRLNWKSSIIIFKPISKSREKNNFLNGFKTFKLNS